MSRSERPERASRVPDTALEPERRALVRASAAIASRSEARLRDALEAAAAGADPLKVEEILVQSYLFLGFPVALNALALWRSCTRRAAPPAAEDDRADWAERGEEVCRKVYGARYENLRRNIAALHPDMDRWMVTEGYGKVLGRAAVDLQVRELCIAALLAVLDVPVQLYSHVRGCLEVGAPPAAVAEALGIAEEYMSAEARERARQVWRKLDPRG